MYPIPSAKGRAFRTLATALLFGLCTQVVQAEYTDPIDLNSIKMPSAQQSLMLDIAQVGNRLIATGERGHILYSDDLGVNWIQADVGTRSQINAVTFLNAHQGWAVGEDQVVVHTADGGKTWGHKRDGRDADQRGPLLDLLFTTPEKGFAIGVFNKLIHTSDGGHSWQEWQEHIDNLDEWHLFALASVGTERVYIASEMGLIFRSRDGGESFEQVQTDHDGSFHGILARAGDEAGRDQLVLFGVGGMIFTSNDGGESWHQLDSGIATGLSGGTWLEDGGALIVGADGVVLKLAADLQRLSLHTLDNGLPLNGVAVSGDQVTLVGWGGIQSYSQQQLLGGE